MAALERSEMADDTAISVVADHGEMLGERGLWAKDSFFEWSRRVPFLVKIPGDLLGRRRTENVSLVDLMPTVLGLATLDKNIRRSQRQRALVGAALAVGKQTSWDYQPQPDYTQTYVRAAVGAEITDRKVRVAAKGYKLPGN